MPATRPETSGNALTRRLVALAAAAVHAGVPDAAGVDVDVRRAGAADLSLSGGTELALRIGRVLADGPGSLDAVDRCHRDRRPVTAGLDPPARSALSAAGFEDVGWLVAVPVAAVDAVVTAWLRRAPRPGDVAALESATPLVADAVRSAGDLRHHLVVPPARLLIEQAKGVLMARHGVGPDDAFDLLRSISQRRNVPVRELARVVVVTGRAPVPRSSADAPQVPAP